jgi:cytochrome c oxidase assembly protein subunit 15
MPAISPERYRAVVAVAGLSLAAIVLTGAAVRLTDAGLACDTVPGCSAERFVPAWEFHPWVEFGNRLISGLVSVLVAAAVLSAYRRRPRRPDLIRWAWGLVAGVAAQILLGAVTVWVHLHPLLVGSHYLLSAALLWMAVVLWVRSGVAAPPGTVTARMEASPAVGRSVIAHGRLMIALAAAVLVTGTLVTGTGPHGGDSRAERLSLELDSITRVHTVTVWCLAAVVLVLAIRLQRTRPPATGAATAGRWLLSAVVAQGSIGYTQYAMGLPAGMVELHVLGSIVVWCMALLTYLRLFERRALASSGSTAAVPARSKNGETGGDGVILSPDLDKIGS